MIIHRKQYHETHLTLLNDYITHMIHNFQVFFDKMIPISGYKVTLILTNTQSTL